MNSLLRPSSSCRLNLNSLWVVLPMMAAALVLSPAALRAANLLVNPSFELNSQHVVPQGWARFAPPTAQAFGNYWVELSNAVVQAHSGLQYFKEWGACYNGTNNAAGIYQDLSTQPGSTYQASGWFYTGSDTLGPDCYVWIEVLFLGSSSNLLALYKSDNFTASVGLSNWWQYTVNRACDISQPASIGDPFFNTYAPTGTVSQITAPVGASTVRYRFVYVQYASEGGSCYLDDAVLNQVSGPVPPVISSVFPLNMIFVNPADGVSFSVSSSGNTIPNSGIGLVLNGVDVSANLDISGTASNKTVTYQGLQSNTVYNASITVTDAFNLTATANSYFETTWVGVPPVAYIWEAEDFDFNGGMYYNSPALCNVASTPNCYFGTVGTPNVDEFAAGTASSHLYRPNDAVGTVIAGDYARKDHYLAGVYDYRIDPYIGGEWLNYTRDWPSGAYWIVGRLSTDIPLSGTLTQSVVNADLSTTPIGTFSIHGGLGWSTFQNVFLKDTNGNNALVLLNGKQTLRVTSGGNLLANFYMLIPVQADEPRLSMYPTGTRPFEYTNALTFTVTTIGSTFPSDGIRVSLDGIDVTTNLAFTGSSSSKTGVYSNLQPNAIHVAIISCTNALGHGILVTNRFDTFGEDNYMVECEDFDYGGGYFIPAADWTPAGYRDALGPYDAVTNIDYQHISLQGEVFDYRRVGIPQANLNGNDYRRAIFQYYGQPDYVLAFFAPTDWANYTREYPPGNYYAYIRSSGDGPFSMYLDQVVSGAGTISQVTRRLGRFGGVGAGYNAYAWVPLTDDGLSLPTVVTFTGTNTLRLTTAGNCNPNFFMFVPVTGISLSASNSAGKPVLSFPSQAGVMYRVFYRTNLTSGNWTVLTTVPGNGAVATVTDVAAGRTRFYKVAAP